MGSAESVPQAYELTGVGGPWLSIARLSLDAGPGGPGRGRPGHRTPGTRRDGARPTAPPVELRNRRLRLRGATVEITVEQMNRALGAVSLDVAGVSDARVWMAPDGPRLVGTFSAGNRRAPFTVRPTVDARADGRRRMRVGLSDVRVYGALPLPAPLIGVALAGAINGALSDAGPHIRAVGPHLDVDVLALALEQALVTRGWRLPDLRPCWLEAVEPVSHGPGGGALRLRFRGDVPLAEGTRAGDPPERWPAAPGVLPLAPAVEGERMPEVGLDAEGHLNGGDLLAAEAALRAALRECPDARPLQARLLALRAAADAAEVAELAATMNGKWPEFVPGWLYAAIAAREAGDPQRSAEAFARVATLCEQRDEREDAGLARAAEAEARAAADQLRATTPARPTTGAALEITQQDQPRQPGGVDALEVTQQDQPPEEVAAAGETEGEPESAPAAEPDGDAGDAGEDRQAVPVLQRAGLTGKTEEAVARGDLAEADALFARRLEAARDPGQAAALLAERARVQMLGPDGARRALVTLRGAALADTSEEGLILRADLAERAGELADARATLAELRARAEAAGDAAHARQLAERLAELAAAQAGDHDGDRDAAADGAAPTAETEADRITARTEAAYADEDSEARASALGRLLEEFEDLPTERRHAAYSSFGRVAESAGDPEHAEEAYWRATRLAGNPQRRADDLLAHARVLISRGNVAAAIGELEEALAMVPDHAGSLALLADRAFQAGDQERARHYYGLLDGAPGADGVIARETLLDRRAELARALGDGAEAEACYRELAQMNARHIEPRQALAELALAREDFRTAADRWEEVLRLLPVSAPDARLDVRQRLVDLHARLGAWGAARTHAELVLAQDPGRVALLERMAEIDERLGLYPAAVEALGRLARLYRQPRQRAEALFRQGEILLDRMNDPAGAFEAHLKSSDLDPTYPPTALRLIEGYWRAGDFSEAAAVGQELRREALGALTPLLRARWALAIALGTPNSGPQALADSGLDGEPWAADAAATALSEAATILAGRAPRELEAATAVLEAWSLEEAMAGAAESAAAPLPAALTAAFARDPAAPGTARALGWLTDREGDVLAARVCYAVAAFLDEGDGAGSRLDELGLAPAPSGQALALLGPAEDAALAGEAAPLRRALAALAHGLAGFDGTAVPTTDAPRAVLSGSPLVIEVQADYAALARAMDAPAVVLIPAPDQHAGSGPVSRGAVPPGGLRVVASDPATIAIPAGLVGLPHDQLTFLVARALDHLRSGLALAAHAGATTGDEVGHLLHGAWAGLTETPLDEPALARSAAHVLADPERRIALLSTGGGERLIDDLDQARQLTATWAAFRAGAERAGDRFAALACRNPLAALRALYRADQAAAAAPADLPERARRMAFLRTSRAGDLLRFLTSPAYGRALGANPDAAA